MNKRFVFDKVNLALLIAGILLLIIGYFVMSLGDIVISPILLTVAYLVVFPAAIVWGAFIGKKKHDEPEQDDIIPKELKRNRKP